MHMLNQAIEDADAFSKMLRRVAVCYSHEKAAVTQSAEVREWNAAVERKRAEKKARKAQHMKALDGFR